MGCGGSTNYGPMFRLVRDRIEIDVPALADKDAESTREALATALSSLLNSLVASANAEQLRIPEGGQGFQVRSPVPGRWGPKAAGNRSRDRI